MMDNSGSRYSTTIFTNPVRVEAGDVVVLKGPGGLGHLQDAFNAGVQWERRRCRYPGCVDNEDERCNRWLTGDCAGPPKDSP